MTGDPPAAAEAYFWELAHPLLEQAGVTRSTMMGFPCLRLDGDFFATCDRRSGDLVVKLDGARVAALVGLCLSPPTGAGSASGPRSPSSNAAAGLI